MSIPRDWRGTSQVSSPVEPALTCPSAPCESGAVLLGVAGSGGDFGYITPAVRVSEDLAAKLKAQGSPERRIRFAQQCVKGRCIQWTGNRCGVIDRVLDARAEHTTHDSMPLALPRCAIRSTCRWFAQAGADACGACPLVLTDLRMLGGTG
jgi:hypothetical protein